MSSSAVSAVSSEVSRFLAEGPLGLFIGGRSVPAKSGKVFETIDPGSGAVLTQVAGGAADDVNAAVEAARTAFAKSGWATMTPNERGVYLHRLADLVEAKQETLAEIESLDTGKTTAQARSDIRNFSEAVRYYTNLAVHVRYREPIAASHHEARVVRQPYGVCGFILPWNFPFVLAGWNLSPSLAAGNTVVVKPAEDTPLSTLYLTRLVQQAGIPDGVVNVVTGYGETAGAALAAHPGLNRMGFTGSPEVGREVAAASGRNLVPVKLELGGKGAAVVFDDVDVEAAAAALTRAVTLHAGQVCCTATRWVVHEAIYDRFVDAARKNMQSVRVGYGKDPETEMGPVVSRKQLDRVCGYLRKGREQGATAVLEGGPAEVPGKHGFYVKPAILEGSPDNVAAREEIFGPVSFMLKFKGEDEVVELVNRSRYGLANSVWSQDLDRANRVAERLVAGNSWINAHNVFAFGVPYAGVNASGMGGGVLGPETLFDYLRSQSVVRPL